jgi:predicted RNase H-like HicB family nuclease
MSDELWEKAEKLAALPYEITIERDELSDGQIVYLARNPKLPGCKAPGATIDEAKASLSEVRVDYICVLLEGDLPVPAPDQIVSITGAAESGMAKNSLVVTFRASDKSKEGESVPRNILQDTINKHEEPLRRKFQIQK